MVYVWKALLLIYFIWGFNWVVMKLGNDFFAPLLFSTWRFAIGSVVLLLVCLYMRLPLPERRLWPWLVITGATAVAFNNLAMQISILGLGAGLAAILNYTMPIWLALLARFFLDEPLTKQKLLGIALSIGGLCLIMNITQSGSLWAVALALTGAVAAAVGNIVFKIKFTACNIISMTTWQMTVGAVILVAASLFTGEMRAEWNTVSIICIAYNGVLASAVAFLMWSYVLIHMEASKAAVSILATPVVGVICGVIFLHEPMTVSTATGMLLVLGGILLVVRQKTKAAEK